MAIGAGRRSKLAPDVPTLDEAIGTSGFEAVLWNVVAAPARTSAEVVELLAAASRKVMSDPSLQETLAGMAIEPVTDSGPAAAAAYVQGEMKKWRPVVDVTGIKLD